MGVSLRKAVQPVQSVRIITTARLHSAVTVTGYSNGRVDVTYRMRSTNTDHTFRSCVVDWESVLRREMTHEDMGGNLVAVETLFDLTV